MIREDAYLDFRAFEELYAWLSEHHDAVPGVELLLYKKGFRDQGIGYEDALRAALCFGWIDSVVHAHDERRYRQHFGPRRAGSTWSAANVGRMKELLEARLVQPAGLRFFDAGLLDRAEELSEAEQRERQTSPELPGACASTLHDDPEAAALFRALPPSHRRQYQRWICNAKQESTRLRRTRKMIAMIREGRSCSEL